MIKEEIDRYEQIAESIIFVTDRLRPMDLIAHPGPGDWSIQELIIHLQDSEMVAIDRMKRIIAEENPPLISYDENLFIQNLKVQEQSLPDALAIIRLGRRQFTRVLRALPEPAFKRTGIHNVRGVLTLAQILVDTNNHIVHHLEFLRKKRIRLSK